MDNLNIQLTSFEVKLIAEIDEFKGAWLALGLLKPEILNSLKRIASIESIGSSTRIEGSKLSDVEVEWLLRNINIEKFESRDQEEVLGYSNLMNEIYQSFSLINFSENYIKQLHKILLLHSSKDIRHRGEYKKQVNNVEAFNPDGSSVGVVFKTASPFETPLLMEKLINWTNKSLKDQIEHPLIIIAIFIVKFLAIHPFQDGNGRLSRALTSLLLLKTGYNYIPYSSLEAVVEKTKENYYIALRRTQQSIKTNSPEYNHWLKYFLISMKQQKDNLLKKIQIEKVILGQLPELSVNILKLAKERGRVTTSDIEQYLHAPKSTIKKRLSELVNSKNIIRHGKGRSTWYSLP